MAVAVADRPAVKLSFNRKVSPISRWEKGAARHKPEIPNGFGLPAGVSCPGMTEACRGVCYAASEEKVYTSVRRMVEENLRVLQSCGDDVDAMAAILQDAVDGYKAKHAKVSGKYGTDFANAFRIHWDGDFYSVAYAQAWRQVIFANPDVQFWAYTRSFGYRGCVDVVPILEGIPNLALYLSTDAYNRDAAAAVAARFPSVRLAVLADTFDAAQAAMVELRGKRAPKCPEVAKKVPMVKVTDEATQCGEGACITCGLCVFGRQDVLFASSKR